VFEEWQVSCFIVEHWYQTFDPVFNQNSLSLSQNCRSFFAKKVFFLLSGILKVLSNGTGGGV
jgi:hypothetical protein